MLFTIEIHPESDEAIFPPDFIFSGFVFRLGIILAHRFSPSHFLGRRRLRVRRRGQLALRFGRGRRRLRFACWRNPDTSGPSRANLPASARGLFGDTFRDNRRALRLAPRCKVPTTTPPYIHTPPRTLPLN